MCTVTYLPLSGEDFILTSNRDESLTRKISLPPAKYVINNTSVFFPKDSEANGSWIATSFNHFTLCLLNGAFEKHISSPPYKKSRGLMLLDFFLYNNITDFIANYEFSGIEPFTLVLLNTERQIDLHELRWDGTRLHHKKLDKTQPYIWSSVTLYQEDVIQQREQWFKEWLKNHSIYTVEEILFFHHFAGSGDKENNLVMNRNEKRTVSITSVVNEKASRTIIYEDIVNKVMKRCRVF